MVFYTTLTIIVLFVIWGISSPDNLANTSEGLLNFTTEKFGWFYLLSTFLILCFAIYLIFSKYGDIRLGKDEDRPEYSKITWFAMLFSAGMGIGLVFWGIAWAPFVGMFIARVSKGRTIREFVLGVLLIPTIASFVWFSVFGGTALNLEIFSNAGLAQAAETDITSALFITLRQLPIARIIPLLATLLIITFFITSADSATFVLGMLSSKGNLNPKNSVKIIWGVLQSSIAIILLKSGGLEGLQTMAIITALPFTIILAVMCFSLIKALNKEVIKK